MAEIDPIIHPLFRLRICGMLYAAEEVEFGVLKRELDVSAPSLSKQVSVLVDNGYIEQRRGNFDSRRVWLSLTELGREKYQAHTAALQELINAAQIQ